MTFPTIDHQDVIEGFRDLLAADSSYRVLRITGESLLGKSHLLRVEFKAICQEERRPHAIFDARDPMTITDVLHQLFSALRQSADLGVYDKLRRQLLAMPSVSVTRTVVMFGRLSASAREPDIWEIGRTLATELIDGLASGEAGFVVLADTVDRASGDTRKWLLDELVQQLCALPRARVVLAGKSLPAAPASYATECIDRELRPVTDTDLYVGACRKAKLTCAEEDIPKFARLLQYRPGLFATNVPVAYPPGSDP